MTQAHGHIDAVWLGCIDYRLRTGRNAYLETCGFAQTDLPLAAGGALDIVYADIDPSGDALRQVGIAVSLHNPEAIVLEAHFDCGAVREFLGKSFASESEERAFLVGALEEAAKLVGKKFPGREIIGILAKPGHVGAPAVFERVFLLKPGQSATESSGWKQAAKIS